MLMPKKIRYRKVQRGRRKGLSKGGREVIYGEYGLQAIEPAWLTAKQIESARVTLSRRTKKIGKLYIRVFPQKPITKKPAETRMGKGKGNVEEWVCVVKRERIMFEVAGLDEEAAKRALKAAAHKLPMRTRVVKRLETTGVVS